VLMKDPNKAIVRMYAVPMTAFVNEDTEEEGAAEEGGAEEDESKE
jgi:hypothetical protein